MKYRISFNRQQGWSWTNHKYLVYGYDSAADAMRAIERERRSDGGHWALLKLPGAVDKADLPC